ncbi:MAG: DinB family protein [Prosthecochloris sp.]|uniref:hypothetical protein n=1 Tax=Prosthecochloris sp. TaxID=290513 RepID=UPI002588E0EE|nr:hypothetical protein [Prosthecochloris sp.]MCW8798994.1 DinB family protein [Prosthecochloris sp.]
MKWHVLIEKEIINIFRSTEQLIRMVDDSALDWKPSSGSNWMTTAQLLMHISAAGGVAIRIFIRGEPGRPEALSANQLSLEEMLPPAEKNACCRIGRRSTATACRRQKNGLTLSCSLPPRRT